MNTDATVQDGKATWSAAFRTAKESLKATVLTVKAISIATVKKARSRFDALDIDSVAEHPLVLTSKEWLRTLGFEHRPAQAVGAAVVAGFLYAAFTDPLARAEAEPREVVAARIAPIGTVNLAQPEGSRIADGTNPRRETGTSLN
jgi:hypothetical protein